MQTVSRRTVIARVRIAGTDRPHLPREFDFMLGSDNTPRQDQQEARRILHQIGYDVSRITSIEEPAR